MSMLRRAALGAFLAATLAAPAHADLVDDVITLSDNATATVLAQSEAVKIGRPRLPRITERTITHNTDYIVITDSGSGPYVSKVGAFDDPNLWSCATSSGSGAAVTVTCDAVPAFISGISWKCDVMDANAHVWGSVRRIYDVTSDLLNEPVSQAERNVEAVVGGGGEPTLAIEVRPDTEPQIPLGQVATRLACDGMSLETATANAANPSQTAAATFGMSGVTRFVCEARRGHGDPGAPVASYTANCLDPGAPGVE